MAIVAKMLSFDLVETLQVAAAFTRAVVASSPLIAPLLGGVDCDFRSAKCCNPLETSSVPARRHRRLTFLWLRAILVRCESRLPLTQLLHPSRRHFKLQRHPPQL
eukprot:TRINITY_DN52246_c0_g1_i1.p1 TRINITY_DN52246_c0_g1~~TRINITY_DN52246_c0_g1_i1.p1  ORF type:complete len:105 (-),score=10.97 TRINITY_DN52246_c0_g1_i1:6-320(-)